MVNFDWHLRYNTQCIMAAVPGSLISGVLISGFYVAQGHRFSLRLVAGPTAFILAYNGLICPMESVTGRRSAAHNFIAGFTMGSLAVGRGMAGVPFVDPYFFMRYPQLSPMVVGGVVYGGIGGALSLVQGKSI